VSGTWLEWAVATSKATLINAVNHMISMHLIDALSALIVCPFNIRDLKMPFYWFINAAHVPCQIISSS